MSDTLATVLADRRSDAAEHEAIVFPTSRVTYGQLFARAAGIAEFLQDKGIQSGDRVGVLLYTSTDYVACLFAASMVGATAVPVNARFRETQIKHIVVQSGMKILISEPAQPSAPDFLQMISGAFGDFKQCWGAVVLRDAPELRQILQLPTLVAADPTWQPQDVDPESTAVLVYTSGTTSAPKGAMLSHRALLFVAQALRTRLRLTNQDRVWTAIPMFHGGGIDYMLGSVVAGATFIHPGVFDADRSLAMLSDEKVTVALPAFETLWLPLIHHPRFAEHDLGALRAILSVGVPERLRELTSALPGVSLVNCVAMTEGSCFVALSDIDDPLESRLTTGGALLPNVECRIVDPETRTDLARGEAGELAFRGDNLFSGYFRDPETTASVIDADGWFFSGDICRLDDADTLTFIGRAKDMLKVGGENVAAAEIEEFIAKHPAVEIVQVVAAPDARYTEVPAAFVQLRPGTACTEEEIIEFCLGRVAAFHVPRYVTFVDQWPMSGTKIRKIDLRRAIADDLKAKGVTEAPKIRSHWTK